MPSTQSQPYSLDIELAVLGGLMSANEAYDQIGDLLKIDSFYLKKNQIIFESISSLAYNNQSHDVISVFEHIKSIDQKNKKEKSKETLRVNQIGGVDYLYEIANQFDTYSNIRSHALILARYRAQRKLIEVGNKINELGNTPAEQNTEQLISDAEHLVFEIGQENFQASNIKDSKSLGNEVKERYNIVKDIDGYSGVETGYREIDEVLLGLQPGGLYILAARPGVGKTSFALNVATEVAKQKKSVLIFSLEMTGEELMRRMITSDGEIDAYKVMSGKLNDSEFRQFNAFNIKLQNLPIDADESAHLNPTELLSRSRRIFKQKKGGMNPLGLIIIDYVQLMNVPWIKDNRVREISEITRHLKVLAKELQIPVLALSQLNREFDKQITRGKPRPPRLSDLRDSGSIEQDADVVLFIERKLRNDKEEKDDSSTSNTEERKWSLPDNGAYNHQSDRGGNQPTDSSQAFIYIAKNRHGATGKYELYFAESYTKFKNKDERPIITKPFIQGEFIDRK